MTPKEIKDEIEAKQNHIRQLEAMLQKKEAVKEEKPSFGWQLAIQSERGYIESVRKEIKELEQLLGKS
jgi:hypothetical protein